MSKLRIVSQSSRLFGEDCMELAMMVAGVSRDRTMVRVLTILLEHGSLSTRELLKHVGSWTKGHRALEKAVDKGLVERWSEKRNGHPTIINRLTSRGRILAMVYKKVGYTRE